MILVIDNSVLVKWYFRYAEELLEPALKIKSDFALGKVELAAPTILIYEFGNVLAKAVSIKGMEKQKVVRMFDLFLESGIKLLDYERLHQKALQISATEKITFYDASYVALSHLENTHLYTADKQLVQKVGRLYPLVKYLSEYGSVR